MAKVVLHLLMFKLEKKELRYIILGTAEGLSTSTPLFLGADLLEGSGAVPAYQCRIHNKYARRGLATKIIVPSDVNFSKVTNLQNGLWFYNIQGVLQATFEYHQPHMQVEIVSRLTELWKRSHLDPLLPDVIQVTTDQLQRRLSKDHTLDQMFVNWNVNVASSSSNHCHKFLVNQETSTESGGKIDDGFGTDSEREHLHEAPGDASFRDCLDRIVTEMKSSMPKWNEEDQANAAAVLAFLHVVESQSGESSSGGEDLTFPSFVDMLQDYQSILGDDKKLQSFCSPWGISDRSNALLCLVSEWLGKKLFCFNEAIARRIDEFKTQNINHIQDLPPPQVLVQELFPQCMQLLVSYWIGLYSDDSNVDAANGDETKDVDDVATSVPPFVQNARKHKNLTGSQSRADHSYSSGAFNQGSNEDTAPPTKRSRSMPPSPGTINATNAGEVPIGSSYEDHNYFSPNSAYQLMVVEGGSQNGSQRDDHTYVAINLLSEQDEGLVASSTAGNRRKDHTYVATTHGRKSKGSSVGSASPKEELECVAEPPATTVKRSHAVHLSQGFKPASNSIDSSKYPFIQIILEFINNALISGVAHVVYTRLLISG